MWVFAGNLSGALRAGMTQKVLIGGFDKWEWRLALCVELRQGSM